MFFAADTLHCTLMTDQMLTGVSLFQFLFAGFNQLNLDHNLALMRLHFCCCSCNWICILSARLSSYDYCLVADSLLTDENLVVSFWTLDRNQSFWLFSSDWIGHSSNRSFSPPGKMLHCSDKNYL